MSWQNLFSKLGFARSRYRVSKRSSRSRWYRQLHLEPLEHRQLLSITVNTLVDENDGIAVGGISLRDAIAAATPGETIDFSVTGTINLTHGALSINKQGNDLTIIGPGATLLSVDASGNDPTPAINDQNGSGVFTIAGPNPGGLVSISGITITGADASGNGGGIVASETLFLSDCVITGNHAGGSGGGIHTQNNQGLTINHCTISGNSASTGGGVSYQANSVSAGFGLTISASTIDSNVATGTGTSGRGGGVRSVGGAKVQFQAAHFQTIPP